jgi:hypothetical protein
LSGELGNEEDGRGREGGEGRIGASGGREMRWLGGRCNDR